MCMVFTLLFGQFATNSGLWISPPQIGGNSSQNPSAARNLISIADPDSLFLAGNGMPACRGKHGPGSCYSCTALQVPYSFSGVVHHRWCQLLPFRVAGASVINGQKRVRFLRSTRTDFRWRDLWEVLLCRSLVSLCFSSSTFWKGRCLVSMVLILTLFLCFYFSRFTVKLWAGSSETWTCEC